MNRSIEEINKIVDIVLSDQDVQDELNRRILDQNLENLKKKKAFEDGEKCGEKRGEKNKQIEIAKKLLEKNETIEYIMETTGLTEEEIKQLQ